jgi:ribonuclease D
MLLFPACALLCVTYARARLRALPPRRTASAHALEAHEDASGSPGGAAATVAVLQGTLLTSAAAMKATSSREIIFVASRAALAAAARAISCAQALGVDAERSAHSFHGYICTLQVSTADADFVFDLLEPCVRDGVADALRGAFLDAGVPKILHGGMNDVQWLSFDLGLFFNGLVDTSLLAAAVDDALPAGLSKLRAEVLGLPVEEKGCYQRGDWRRRPLPPDYLRYAASDSAHLVALAAALVERAAREKGAALETAIKKTGEMAARRFRSRETFNAAKAESGALRAARERGLFALSELENSAFVSGAHARFALALARDCAQGDVASDDDLLEAALQAAHLAVTRDDIAYADVYGSARSALPSSGGDAVEIAAAIARGLLVKGRGEGRDSGPKASADAKAERRARVYRTGPSALYDNCELCGPDGVVLARISKKKADWYIGQGHAEAITVYDDGGVARGAGAGARPAAGEPGGALLRVRMFNPSKGKGHSGDLFFLAPRANVCNVCGVSAEKATREGLRLFRLFVCPRVIRAQLPQVAKSFTNHDVLLACSNCKPVADRALLKQLQGMARELGVQRRAAPGPVDVEKSDGSDGDDGEDDEVDADGADDDSKIDADGADDATSRGPSAASVRHLRQLTRPLVQRLAPTARILEIFRLLCEPAAVSVARRVAQAPQRAKPAPRPRGKVDAQRLHARQAKQDAAVASFIAAWGDGSIFCGDAATADAVAASGLDAPLVLALFNAPIPHDADGDGGAHTTFDNTAVLIMEAVYEGGAAWARAAEAFAPFLPRVVRAPSARGFSGLLFDTEDRAAAVVVRFRAAFVRACQPRALPVAWRVDAPVFPESHTRKKTDEEEAAAVRKARAAMK